MMPVIARSPFFGPAPGGGFTIIRRSRSPMPVGGRLGTARAGSYCVPAYRAPPWERRSWSSSTPPTARCWTRGNRRVGEVQTSGHLTIPSSMSRPMKLTPMFEQYFEIKRQVPDAILFYLLGDVYQRFFDDAEQV